MSKKFPRWAEFSILGGVLVSILAGIIFLLPALCKDSSKYTPPPMEMYVSKVANFVLFKPKGWPIVEDATEGIQYIKVASPYGGGQIEIWYQEQAFTNNVYTFMGEIIKIIQKRSNNFTLTQTMISPDKSKLVFDATYTDRSLGKRKARCWISLDNGKMFTTLCETQAGKFEELKGTLLSILSNLRFIRGAVFGGTASAGQSRVLPLKQCRLSDGSATFSIPTDWSYKDFGKGTFIAQDPNGEMAFLVAAVDILTPALGVNVPGVPISPYLPPDQALAFLVSSQGLGSNFQFLMVNPRYDIAQQMQQVYNAGGVEVAELLYTFTTVKGTVAKGFTLGMCFNSRIGTDWSFRHITFIAPLDYFDQLVPTFVAMGSSYTINEVWAKNYVMQGMQRLAQLQKQTAAVVSRNMEEINQISQAIYEGKKESWDYLDYQTSTYIRGESDWISDVEGGKVYHSDTWGLKDTETGDFYRGKPWDYVNFEGQNPKYNETMRYVDSKEAWKEAFGK